MEKSRERDSALHYTSVLYILKKDSLGCPCLQSKTFHKFIKFGIIWFFLLFFILSDLISLFTSIYKYMYIYVVHSISLQTFRTGIYLKIQYVIAIHLMRWLTNFYDFTFKWTASAAIGIHPTKAWLSQQVNFKNAIWM